MSRLKGIMKINGADLQQADPKLFNIAAIQTCKMLSASKYTKARTIEQLTQNPSESIYAFHKDYNYAIGHISVTNTESPILLSFDCGTEEPTIVPGRLVAIGSYVVKESMRRRGVGQQLLIEALSRISTKPAESTRGESSLAVITALAAPTSIRAFEKVGMVPGGSRYDPMFGELSYDAQGHEYYQSMPDLQQKLAEGKRIVSMVLSPSMVGAQGVLT